MATPIFDLTEWVQDQEQPHVTVNTSLRILEALSVRVLKSKTLTAPPGTEDDGDVFYINGTGSGGWLGHSNVLAVNVAGVWHFVTPKTGWIFWSIPDVGQVVYIEASPSGWELMPT